MTPAGNEGKMKGWFKYIPAAMAVGLATVVASAAVATNRPAKWARPMALPGVSNFYQVTTNLYRGAQPTTEGMVGLQALGVRTSSVCG